MTYTTREGMQSLWTSLFIYPNGVTLRDCPIDLHLFQYSVGDLVPTFGAPATVRAELRHTNISRPLPQSRGDRFQLLPNVTWQACEPPQVECLSANKPTIDVSIGYGFHGLDDYRPRLVVAQAVADEPLWLLITWRGYFTATYDATMKSRPEIWSIEVAGEYNTVTSRGGLVTQVRGAVVASLVVVGDPILKARVVCRAAGYELQPTTWA